MTEVKIEDDVGSSVLMTGNHAPTFSGDPEDFERWARLVRSWKKLSTMKPEKQAHKIMLSQTNAEVLEVMMSIDEETVDGPNRLDIMMKVMTEKYAIDREDLAWPAHDNFDSMVRNKNETAEKFVLRYELAYHKARSYDKELMISDRSLTMSCMRRLNITTADRAAIIGQMKGKMTTRALVKAMKSLYEGDVPQKADTNTKTTKEKKEDMSLMSAEEEGAEGAEDDSAAYFSKFNNKNNKTRFTKGFSKEDVFCTRCGKDGHDAADCVLSWQQGQKSKRENAHKFKPEMSYMALPCTICGDPNCKSWVYEDSTDDEIFFDQDGADDEE